VPGKLPDEAPEKPPETLILQGFRALSPVAKRGISGYNMSYFIPVLSGLGKVPPDTNFQVSKN